MFEESELDLLRQSPYKIIQMNHHDVTIHSSRTGHDWIIVSNYSSPACYILHRHSGKYPYHQQKGHFRSIKDAMEYIDYHEDWFVNRH